MNFITNLKSLFKKQINITLVGGRQLDVLNMTEDEITIEDIAKALSNICRYNGHVKKFYSVAEHSVFCCKIAKAANYPTDFQKTLLLHDASEAYCGDVISPIKQYLGKKYKNLENKIAKKIFNKFSLSVPFENFYVKMIDINSRAYEVPVVKFGNWSKNIVCLDPTSAENQFLEYYEELFNDN